MLYVHSFSLPTLKVKCQFALDAIYYALSSSVPVVKFDSSMRQRKC